MAVRTCVGCREAGPTARMIRFTLAATAVPEDGGVRAGWIHPDPRCVRAARGKSPPRWKQRLPDLTPLVLDALRARLVAALPAAWRRGELVTGRLALVGAPLALAAGPAPPWCPAALPLPVSREDLGAATGGTPRRAVAVRDPSRALASSEKGDCLLPGDRSVERLATAIARFDPR